MKGRLLNLLTALSLLMCVAVVALWVRSYFTTDRFDYQRTKKLYSALLHVGTPQLVHVDRDSRSVPVGFYHSGQPVRAGATWSSGWAKPVAVNGVLGFGIVRATYYRVVAVPLWLIFSVAVVPPVLRLRAAHRSKVRRRLSLCPACGYDLRATPDLCPECGRRGREGSVESPLCPRKSSSR